MEPAAPAPRPKSSLSRPSSTSYVRAELLTNIRGYLEALRVGVAHPVTVRLASLQNEALVEAGQLRRQPQ